MASSNPVLPRGERARRQSGAARPGRARDWRLELRPHAARASRLLKALANEQRLMILCNLVSGPLSVGELNERLPLSQSALSQHLALLRDAGIVTSTRAAQSVIYALPAGIVTRIIGLLYEQYCPR